jgi:hypothetical protein
MKTRITVLIVILFTLITLLIVAIYRVNNDRLLNVATKPVSPTIESTGGKKAIMSQDAIEVKKAQIDLADKQPINVANFTLDYSYIDNTYIVQLMPGSTPNDFWKWLSISTYNVIPKSQFTIATSR